MKLLGTKLGDIVNETGKTKQDLFTFLPNVFLSLEIWRFWFFWSFYDVDFVWGLFFNWEAFSYCGKGLVFISLEVSVFTALWIYN